MALDNGFSNSKTYRQCFKKVFKESPKEYRSKYSTPKKIEQESPSQIKLKPLSSRQILITLYSYAQILVDEQASTELSSKQKRLAVTVTETKEFLKSKELILTIGQLSNLNLHHVQKEIRTLKNKNLSHTLEFNRFFQKFLSLLKFIKKLN